MRDETHLRVVDPHAERGRGADHANAPVQEGPLRRLAPLDRQTRMVWRAGHPRPRERDRKLRAQPARARIDDRRRPPARRHLAPHAPIGFARIGGHLHGVAEVRAVRGHEDADRSFHPQEPLDLAPRPPRRGGGEGRQRRVPHPLPRAPDPQVRRAEVVPPLGNAVRLVDGDAPHPDFAQAIADRAVLQAFGRQVQEVEFAATGALERRVHLLPRGGARPAERPDLPKPVGSTASVSRPLRTASTTRDCAGRKSS